MVRTLIPTYGDRVIFMHQEIWQASPAQGFFPTVEEWNLRSEPWICIVDGKGFVRYRHTDLAQVRPGEGHGVPYPSGGLFPNPEDPEHPALGHNGRGA
jgi:hypothetical protein